MDTTTITNALHKAVLEALVKANVEVALALQAAPLPDSIVKDIADIAVTTFRNDYARWLEN